MKISSLFAATSMACIVFTATSTPLSAQDTTITETPQAELDQTIELNVDERTLISISVPEGSTESATYTVDGKQFTIAAGESVILPKGVKDLVLPKGVSIQSRETRSDGSIVTAVFTANKKITLSTLTVKAARQASDNLTLVKYTTERSLKKLRDELIREMEDVDTVTGGSATDGIDD